jgi:hypothetical protein
MKMANQRMHFKNLFDFDEALDHVPYLEDILNNAFEEVLNMDEA